MKNIIENKNQRSASVSFKDNKKNKNINQKIKEGEINDNLNFNNKKGFHHRKRTSSYFFGSYLPDSNIFENNDKKEYNINPNLSIDKNEKHNNNENEKLNKNEMQNKLLYNLYNSENSNNLSLSFPSYDENNNNSEKIKKLESPEKKENKSCKNDNNIILEMNRKIENSTKSFITFKNSLKYMKDKEERTTPSYQLALQTDRKDGNNFYVATSNIIEEEKSSVIESKTEFSNKKEMICSDEGKNKKENDKRFLEEHNDIDIINNLNFYYGKINDKNDMSLKLNEIIIKNNKKEEDRRKFLTQNKMNLLNTFFTMSNTFLLNKFKDKENYLKKEKKYYDFDNNKLMKDKISSNGNYFKEKKITRKFCKKTLYCNNNAFTDNEIQKIEEISNLNNENNIETENTKKNISKIPHLSTMRKINNNIKNDSPINVLTKGSYKDIKTSNSNNSSSRNNSLLSKKLSKILVKNDSNRRNNIHSLKRIENLNNALTFIREKKKKKLNLDLEKRKYYGNNTYNFSYIKKLNNATYTSSLTNSNLNTNNSNTQSHSKSKSKEKMKILYRKSNSGSFNSKGEYISQKVEDNLKLESNKEKTIKCLKNKLLFSKLYEKIDALEKISSTSFSTKSFFVILCENKINQYKFNGLFKYYKDKEKFIKIYGDEKCPNYILFKDINVQNKYQIIEDNDASNILNNKFTLLNHFKSTNNAIILIKN